MKVYRARLTIHQALLTEYKSHGSVAVKRELAAHRALTTMGWLRIVGSLKLQVSIGEYSLFNRALLQKRAIPLRSLLIIATPYI